MKSLDENIVQPPENRRVVQPKEYLNKQFSLSHLEPPQPPEADCEDHINYVQLVKSLPEIYIASVKFVDLFRNLHQQFRENNLITVGININFTRPCKSLIDWIWLTLIMISPRAADGQQRLKHFYSKQNYDYLDITDTVNIADSRTSRSGFHFPKTLIKKSNFLGISVSEIFLACISHSFSARWNPSGASHLREMSKLIHR